MRTWLPIAILIFVVSIVCQIGEATKSVQVIEQKTNSIKHLVFRFVASPTGEITAASPTQYDYSGEVLQFSLISDASDVLNSGVKIYLVDSKTGYDVLYGAGENINLVTHNLGEETSATVYAACVTDELGTVINGKLIFSVTCAGDTRAGTANLFIR